MVAPMAVMSLLLPVRTVLLIFIMFFLTLFGIVFYFADRMISALFDRCRLVDLLEFLNGKIFSRRHIQMVGFFL